MRGIIVTQTGGTIEALEWQEAPPVLSRWGRLFARMGFQFDAFHGTDGWEHLFMYEERRGNPLPGWTELLLEVQK